ncbi:hypothetical protein DL93DRAFT_2228132 [Clavulina sp. PMI_390]|nr:hypothetical protein DL93DRAFT_2228132 [Clavulina sp. PMI_390]
MMSSPSPPPHDEGREREREREGSPYSGPPSSPRHRSSSTIQLEAAPPHSQSYYSHPSSRSYPYSRPKIASPKSRPVYRSGNASSDVESDSQRSTSTRDDPHAMYEFERSQRTRAGSSSLLYSRSHSSYPGPGPSRSRTRSVSPSRRPHLSSGIGGGSRSHLGANPYPPHGSQERGQAVGRTHSESTAIGMRSRGGSVGSPGSSSRVTLEWACANANKLPSSPLKPHEGEITDECEDRDIKPSVDDGDGHGYRDGPEYDVPTVRSRRRGSSSARYELNITRPGGIPTDRDGKDSVLKHLPPFHHSRSHQSSHRLDPQEDEVDELELTETEAELDGDVGGGADGRTDASLSLMSMSTMDDTTEALTPFDGRSLNSSSSSPGIRLGSMSRESSFGQSWPGPGAENGTVRGKSSSGASSRVLHSGLSALMDASSLVRHPADHKLQQSRDGGMRKAASGPVGSARDNERDRNDAWLAQSSGRTVRNPNAPASHSHLVHHPSSYSRSHSHSAARSSRSHSSRSLGRGVATPAPVSREVIAAAATDNSQQEIDAALALVGLFSAQPPESSVHEVKTEDSKDN